MRESQERASSAISLIGSQSEESKEILEIGQWRMTSAFRSIHVTVPIV